MSNETPEGIKKILKKAGLRAAKHRRYVDKSKKAYADKVLEIDEKAADGTFYVEPPKIPEPVEVLLPQPTIYQYLAVVRQSKELCLRHYFKLGTF